MKKLKKPNKCNIGGQAVLEGVMMRGERSVATAVRDEQGIIRLETDRIKPAKEKNAIFRMPIIRGAVNFFSSMVTGTKILLRSAEVYGEEEPTKFEKFLSNKFKLNIFDVMMGVAVVLAIALSIFLFIACPQYLTNFVTGFTNIEQTSFWFNLIEGGVRILIFIGYILLTSLMKDIKRTYMYHGAEHKTISCYESGLELTVENVRKCSRLHDRCGTTFMFLVMIISVLVFSIANSFVFGATGILRLVIKIALLPIIAGISYEILKLLAKTESKIVFIFKAPGLALQKITTKEPTDDMIEVAITAFKTVLEMDKNPEIKPQKFITPMEVGKLLELVKEKLRKGGIDEVDGEWIVCHVSGVKRSELENNKTRLLASQVENALQIADERLKFKPLWYILGSVDFYGYEFKIDERALIPRPETEELVMRALEVVKKESLVLDLCTGSGAIAITINKKTGAKVDAVDVKEEALSLARENAQKLEAEVNFIKSDMFKEVDGVYDVIVSNPPYIKTEDIKTLQKEVAFEPISALDGGEDGLEFYKQIATSAKEHLTENGVLLMECGFDQKEEIMKLLTDFSQVICIKDINGIDRIIKAVK